MASVGDISRTAADGIYYVQVRDFDPKIMDVVIVAKDARRVWVENESNGGQGMHLKKPYQSSVGWQSNLYHELGFEVVRDLRDYALVEFVAVSTDVSLCHSEPVKPADAGSDYEPIPTHVQAEVSAVMREAGIPETSVEWSEPTAQERVCEIYPDSQTRQVPGGMVQVLSPMHCTKSGRMCIADGQTVDAAWENAWTVLNNLDNAKPVVDLDPLGCCQHFVCESVPSLS